MTPNVTKLVKVELPNTEIIQLLLKCQTNLNIVDFIVGLSGALGNTPVIRLLIDQLTEQVEIMEWHEAFKKAREK